VIEFFLLSKDAIDSSSYAKIFEKIKTHGDHYIVSVTIMPSIDMKWNQSTCVITVSNRFKTSMTHAYRTQSSASSFTWRFFTGNWDLLHYSKAKPPNLQLSLIEYLKNSILIESRRLFDKDQHFGDKATIMMFRLIQIWKQFRLNCSTKTLTKDRGQTRVLSGSQLFWRRWWTWTAWWR
jgi:hypothetical protein